MATSFVAAGIFLVPMIAKREPKHQGTLAFALLGALAVVVLGDLIGSFLGIHGVLEGAASNWSGPQGLRSRPRADLAGPAHCGPVRLAVHAWRVMRGRLAGEHRGNMPWLFFLAALAIRPSTPSSGSTAQPTTSWSMSFWLLGVGAPVG